MNRWLEHLPVLPIVVPLLAGASMLLFAESQRRLRDTIAVLATLVQLGVALGLMYLTTDAVPDIWHKGIGVYSISAWPAPYGIVLVVDRLSALLLVLSATLTLPAIIYSTARWERVGVHYQPLLQFLLMGLNGAFLTGDLFNLFVFFEVLLASSYGLILHGSGPARVKAGLHYIVVNLLASLLFLIGVALIYGVTGTLNMADLGVRWSSLPVQDRGLFDAGVAILGIAFLIKAGSWPMNFWLPSAYAAAGASVAAVFSIMTKVGVYAVLRMSVLLGDASAPVPLGGPWLFYGGLATLIFGIVGLLASQQLGRLISCVVIVSSGTLLATVGSGAAALTAPALFYMISSVLATAAFFMLTGMTERTRTTQASEVADVAPLPAVSYQAFGADEPADPRTTDEEVGIAIPAVMAFLGLAFVCCVLLVCGLPPLSGFVGKFALLSSIVESRSAGELPATAWVLFAALLAAGMAGLIALTRIGMRLFWTVTARTTPRLRAIEAGPVAFLLLLTMALAAGAQPVMTYLESAAATLHDPQMYIEAVLTQDVRCYGAGSAMNRFPVMLAIALFCMWLLLNNSVAPGHVVIGAVLAFFIARGSVGMRPLRPRIRNLHKAILLIFTVLLDIVRSNITVARVVLGLTGDRQVTPGFMGVPLDMRDPHGLAMLAVILTATPGTVWVDLSADGRELTLHVLDLHDEAQWKQMIKQRYERPLMEIFE